jgi:hypothetical protein
MSMREPTRPFTRTPAATSLVWRGPASPRPDFDPTVTPDGSSTVFPTATGWLCNEVTEAYGRSKLFAQGAFGW